jgi:hypothetical protein
MKKVRPFYRLLFLAGLLQLGLLALSGCGDNTATSNPTTATGAATTTSSGTTSAATTIPSTTATTAAATTARATTTVAASTTAAASTTTTSTTAGGTTSAVGGTSTTTAAGATGGDTSPKVVDAANAFLATLDASQKSAVLFDWSNTAQKQRWSNFPNGAFQRAGVMWGNLSDASKQAWLTVMSTTLSKGGYQRVLNEWNADDALAATDNGGGGANFGTKYYWIAIIGTPSTTSPWQWQWGGHHVTINATVAKSNITLAPSFIGDQPASYKDANGNTIVPLGDIDTTAIALLNSLDATQKSKAVLGTTTIDLVLGPGQDGKKIASEGLPGSAMNADQQNLLMTLMGYYGNLLNDEDAALRMADLKSHLADTYFAWYGSTTAPNEAYFRVTGPTVVIEYSPQGAGGGPGGGRQGAQATTAAATTQAASTTQASGTTPNVAAPTSNHIHGIYRDPTNDYGASIVSQ